ncbi:MAG: PQQ-binding-like beta-propeller repeat protein [Polyangiales bacterium]
MFRANARRTGHYEVTGLPARGRTRWKFAYPSGAGTPSTPLVLGDRIIAADRGGVVTALEPKKGAALWTANLGGETYSSPCAADGLVFIATCAKTLAALDAQTGATRWSAPLGDATYASPVAADGLVVVGDHGGHLHAFDASSGAPRWTLAFSGYQADGLAAYEGRVYFNSAGPGTPPTAGALHCVELATGRLVYKVAAGDAWYSSACAIGGGRVYCPGGRSLKLHAIDLATRAEAWSHATGNVVVAAPALAGDAVVFGSYDRALRALDAATGQLRWSLATRQIFLVGPSVAAGVVYAASGKELRAVDLATGGELWLQKFPKDVSASPVPADGALYVTLSDALVALG